MSEHTPGPWEYRPLGRIFIGSVRNFAAVCELIEFEQKDETLHANGRLITAAPDLLEACKEAAALFGESDVLAARMVRDAIAKAEGTI